MKKKGNPIKGIMSACNYSLVCLENIKKALMDFGNPKKELITATGGLVVTLASRVIVISQEVIKNSLNSEDSNAREDLKEIQRQFNEFIDRMINND